MIYQTPDNQLIESTNKEVISKINDGFVPGPRSFMVISEREIDFIKTSYDNTGP